MERPVIVAGYSGTPLARKLGIVPGCRVLLINAPPEYEKLLAPIPDQVDFINLPSQGADLVHFFVSEQKVLVRQLDVLRKKIKPAVPIWVSWPKKASRMPSTVTEDTIRAAALPLGYVDIKVCAVSDIWSGLKLVVRKELR